jgi:hypothetical protein
MEPQARLRASSTRYGDIRERRDATPNSGILLALNPGYQGSCPLARLLEIFAFQIGEDLRDIVYVIQEGYYALEGLGAKTLAHVECTRAEWPALLRWPRHLIQPPPKDLVANDVEAHAATSSQALKLDSYVVVDR